MLRGARCVVRSGEAVNEGKILRPVGSNRLRRFALQRKLSGART